MGIAYIIDYLLYSVAETTCYEKNSADCRKNHLYIHPGKCMASGPGILRKYKGDFRSVRGLYHLDAGKI